MSFESAARDHGLATVEPTGPHVFTVPHSGPQRLSGVVVHQISDVAAIDVVCLDGFRTTTVERTIVDLAAIWRRGRIRLVLDDAVASKKTTIESVGACLQRVARRGKPGVALLTSVLEEHSPGEPVPNSVLEADLFRLLRRAGLPMPSAQYPLPRDDGVVGLADGAWIEIKLIVEVDGRRWHQRIQNMKKDRDRDIKAAAEGWQVIRPLHEHVVGAPEETARELRTIIATRSQQLGVSNPTGISI